MPLDLIQRPIHRFPCPLCGQGLDERETKKKKPYVICDPCGVQLFVRSKVGVRIFEQLVGEGEKRNIWKRLDDLQSRYQRKCPECGTTFWIVPDLLKTSWMDGKFEGYRCPGKDCPGVVSWNKEKK